MFAPALLALLPVGWDSCRLPTFEWLLLDSGAGASMSYAMTDMGAHLYFGGHTAGNLSIIGANGVEHHYSDQDAHKDLYVVKIDPAVGEPVAVFLLDGDATGSSNVLMDLAPMPDGQHLGVAGYFRGDMNMPTGSGSAIMLSNPNSVSRNAFVSVMNADSGHTVWARHITSEEQTNAYGVAADGAGNVVAVGSFCFADRGCGGSVSKFAAADGTDEWSLIDENVSFWGVKASASGDVYAAGSHRGTFDRGGTATPQTSSNGGEDDSTLVLRLTQEGTPVWAFSFGDGGAFEVNTRARATT